MECMMSDWQLATANFNSFGFTNCKEQIDNFTNKLKEDQGKRLKQHKTRKIQIDNEKKNCSEMHTALNCIIENQQ